MYFINFQFLIHYVMFCYFWQLLNFLLFILMFFNYIIILYYKFSLSQCTYIFVIFSYFCDITFNFSYSWKVLLFSWRQMVSQGFIFYVSKIPVIISTHSNDGVKKKIFNYNYRNWLSGTFSSHLKDKKFKWVNKSYGVTVSYELVLKGRINILLKS